MLVICVLVNFYVFGKNRVRDIVCPRTHLDRAPDIRRLGRGPVEVRRDNHWVSEIRRPVKHEEG